MSSFYTTWKSNYLRSACSPGQYYVQFEPNGGVQKTVSEAHGYGMLITVIMAGFDPNAQTIFDGFINYLLAHPSSIFITFLKIFQSYTKISLLGF